MWPAIALIAAFVAFSVWSSWDARRKLIARLGDRWGLPRSETPDLENVADFFREHPADAALDDRTWTDLLMDDVFAHLDRTESRVGQQMLYRRLRVRAHPNRSTRSRRWWRGSADDMAFRAQTQSALVRLSHSSVYYLHRLVRPDTLNRPWWYAVFPVWTAAVLTTLILGVVWHGLFLRDLRPDRQRRDSRDDQSARGLGSRLVSSGRPLMSVAWALAACDTPATAAITGGMAADRAALRRLGAIARWVSRGNDAGASTDLIGALIEYINIQLLMDVNALYFASRELRTRGAHFVQLIEAVGDIDAAIAVASFRASAAEWVRPRFVAPQMPAVLTDLRHPLVDDAVPNSIALARAARRADHRIEHVRQVDLSAHRRRERRVGADHQHVSRGAYEAPPTARAAARAGGRSGRGKATTSSKSSRCSRWSPPAGGTTRISSSSTSCFAGRTPWNASRPAKPCSVRSRKADSRTSSWPRRMTESSSSYCTTSTSCSISATRLARRLVVRLSPDAGTGDEPGDCAPGN